jgi:abortive infection bacteriophage resistance protein
MKYTKPSLSIQDQLELLKARNLIIPDDQRAKRYLTFIGYYRLSVYFLPFHKKKDEFDSGTKFDDILNLYIFDRKLKLLALDAIERIEIAIKAVISNYMSQKFDIHWFLNKNLFQKKSEWDYFIKTLDKAIQKNKKKDHIKHYLKKYGSKSPYPPSWNVMEILTFGNVSHIFSNLRGKHKKKIARVFNLTQKTMDDILRSVVDCRNLCAHHERFWNSKSKHSISSDSTKLIAEKFSGNNRSTYFQLYIIDFMMKQITSKSTWNKRIAEHTLILSDDFLEKHMGFPENSIF